jgi:putative endonuclease
MSMVRKALGKWGEDLAAGYLAARGYHILAQNARTPYGELDLVASEERADGVGEGSGTVTVFVEVKTRRSSAFGLPEASVTTRKQAHLLASAQAYLQAHPDLEGDWRIDVIAIQQLPGQPEPSIVHFENVVN